MISVGAASKGGAASDWDKEKNASGSHWDPVSFEQQVGNSGDEKWNETKRKKSPNRFQDITLGMEDNTEPQSEEFGKEQTWPFESSPCAWSGGSNTREGANSEEVNKALFDSNFTDATCQIDSGFESIDEAEELESSDFDSGADSFCGDSEPDAPDLKEDSSVTSAHASSHSRRGLDSSVPFKSTTQSYCSGLAWNRSNHSNKSFDSSEDADNRRLQDKKNMSLCSASAHARVRTESDLDAKAKRKKSKRMIDPLGSTSCHGQIETKVRRPATHRKPPPRSKRQDKDSLSATCHGKIEKIEMKATRTSSRRPKRREDEPVEMPGEPHASRSHPSRRKQPSRTRSGSRDELAGASVHGVASVSRVRSGTNSRKSESSRSKHGDRRSRLTRTVSSTNVKQPEEHYQSRREPMDEGLDVSRSGGRSRRSSSHGKSSSRSSSSRNLMKKASPRKQRYSSRSSESEFSDEDNLNSLKDRGLGRSSHRRRTTVERRDLLLLLREKKAVHKTDFLDKENRRLLHFLLYEHQMEVSLRGLHESIRKELAMESDETGQRKTDPAM